MDESEVYRVTDPRALKAVAHPLRGRLLGALRVEGPATATELAAKFGESSGSTSYHLRQLARYGFVEEDPERRDARERRWRAIHRYTAWNEAELDISPEGREAAGDMRERQLMVLVRDHEIFERDRDSYGPEWIEAAGMSDDFGMLTAASVKQLHVRIKAILRELEAEDADAPGRERVALHVAAFPTRRYPA
ncbi:helix-turn-helix domain-containing protein [Sphaerisporangium sp. B11E5]|uniref:winged helix-turn-helix domain-containing protein n=1 Tax=Sphaerisporangium sp. B11E5 TaxID=3153563 RepID=UPI00325F6765